MKTRTYVRLALLIPLVIWVILLPPEILINLVMPADLQSSGPDTFFGLIEIVFAFYVIGILFWFLPYLILSIVVLFASFRSRLEVLKYLLFLSPFAMALLIMTELAIISVATWGFSTTSAGFQEDIIISTAFFLLVGVLGLGILALVWGYLCVGLGFGGYKILQRFGKIKDEEMTKVEIIHVNNQAAQGEI